MTNLSSKGRFERDLEEILHRSSSDLEDIVQSRVLVTGGSGFVGRWLVSSFAKFAVNRRLTGHIVSTSRTCPDWQKPLLETGALHHVPWDVNDALPQIGQFGYVFHAAVPASAKINSENPTVMRSTIDSGIERILEYFAESQSRIVNLSSGAVYGIQPSELAAFSEEWSENPNKKLPDSEYHLGKARAERRLNEGTIAAKIVHARLFAFLAPFLPLDTHFAAGNFVGAAIKGEKIRINGDSRTVRTYMYGVDLVGWMTRIARFGTHQRAYNVGSDEQTSVGELASAIASRSPHKLTVELGRTASSEGSIHRYVPDVRRCREELGLEIDIPLSEAISRTLEWGSESN